jgi:hypothetical protein
MLLSQPGILLIFAVNLLFTEMLGVVDEFVAGVANGVKRILQLPHRGPNQWADGRRVAVASGRLPT